MCPERVLEVPHGGTSFFAEIFKYFEKICEKRGRKRKNCNCEENRTVAKRECIKRRNVHAFEKENSVYCVSRCHDRR